ncbi:hypothetical protein JT05_07710 [Desulfosporosinus sp. Tol-M]|nr:hypothetical protein JT05_07710 [Desulfosporosinus sp. Tol-M]
MIIAVGFIVNSERAVHLIVTTYLDSAELMARRHIPMTMQDRAKRLDIFIQLNAGNSGSPVINNQAQVVGVIFGVTTFENEGVSESRGLAIPIKALPKKYFDQN